MAVGTRDRRHIANRENGRCARTAVTQKREYRIGAIVADQPLKAARLGITLMQSALCLVKLIEIAKHLLHTGIEAVVQPEPLDFVVVRPLTCLRQFGAHKE